MTRIVLLCWTGTHVPVPVQRYMYWRCSPHSVEARESWDNASLWSKTAGWGFHVYGGAHASAVHLSPATPYLAAKPLKRSLLTSKSCSLNSAIPGRAWFRFAIELHSLEQPSHCSLPTPQAPLALTRQRLPSLLVPLASASFLFMAMIQHSS